MSYRSLTRAWLYINAVTALMLLLTGLYFLALGEPGRALMWILFAMLLRTYR